MMDEFIELRVREDQAGTVFRPDEGVLLSSGLTRRIVIRGDDTRLPAIIARQADLQAQRPRELLVSSASITRKYSATEWAAAELFSARINAIFDPTGVECGTQYDESELCPMCGAGRVRVGPLRLDLRRVPKEVDIAQTIAGDEIIVSERVADAITKEPLTGVDLTQVEQATKRGGARRASWFAMAVTSTPLRFSSAARFGNDAVEPQNPYACPVGDTLGHALLSEARLVRPSDVLSDFHLTAQYIEGPRRGLFVPRRILLLSPKAERALRPFKSRTLYLEVAQFD